jgi:hypothetical protein
MNKSRCVGLIVLLTLLLAPYGFTSSANQGFENEISIYGNVKVRGTPSGHVTVAVDRSFPMRGIQADGVADLAVHFAPRKNRREYQNIAFDVEGGVVDFSSRRVTVFSADRHILLNLMLENRPENEDGLPYYNDTSRDLLETVRINRGKALGRYKGTADIGGLWLCGVEGGRCSVIERTGEMKAATDPIELENPCPSGGTGSTSCSIECGPGQGCSTSCGAGYYACCHCTNGCHCLR